MGEQSPKLRTLRGAEVVLGSAVWVPDPKDPRHDKANLAAAKDSARTGVPHLYMVDNSSHPDVFGQLEQAGAIAVLIDHDTEGGLARPYMIAAQLVDHYAGENTLFGKLEGDKNIARNRANIEKLLQAAEEFDVITGARSAATMQTMASYQRTTEGKLADAIKDIADVPYDVASGVLALTSKGREVFYRFTGTDWSYLIHTPRDAQAAGLPVGGVELDFVYNPDMVVAEFNPNQDAKRRDQFRTMLDAAVAAAGGLSQLNERQWQTFIDAVGFVENLELQAQPRY